MLFGSSVELIVYLDRGSRKTLHK